MLELLGEGVKIAAAAAVAQWELKPLTSIPPVTALHVGQVCFFIIIIIIMSSNPLDLS